MVLFGQSWPWRQKVFDLRFRNPKHRLVGTVCRDLRAFSGVIFPSFNGSSNIFATVHNQLNQRSARVVFSILRQEWEFLTLNLRLRDETEKKHPPLSGIETRSRSIIFILRFRDENENSLDLISFFETRPRILKFAIIPWNQAWMASPISMQFLGG